MTPPFEIEVVRAEGAPVRVVTRGELDLATVPELERRVGELLDEDGPILLDLSALGFIDLAGVSLLVRLVDAAAGRGRSLRMVAPTGHVRRVIDLVGADRQLPFEGGEEAGADQP